MAPVETDAVWYVDQGGSHLRGPYTAVQIGRFLALGRVKPTTRVCRDGGKPEPVSQIPELIPEELLDLDEGWLPVVSRSEPLATPQELADGDIDPVAVPERPDRFGAACVWLLYWAHRGWLRLPGGKAVR